MSTFAPEGVQDSLNSLSTLESNAWNQMTPRGSRVVICHTFFYKLLPLLGLLACDGDRWRKHGDVGTFYSAPSRVLVLADDILKVLIPLPSAGNSTVFEVRSLVDLYFVISILLPFLVRRCLVEVPPPLLFQVAISSTSERAPFPKFLRKLIKTGVFF